jgi:enamine deaminase RidA (YjgF/YER057c/UK114 family)
MRVKDRVLVSGIAATFGADRDVAPDDAGAQTTFILDKIAASLGALGAALQDVLPTRIDLREERNPEVVSPAHGRMLGEICPAKTMIVAGGLIGEYRVGIAAEAMCDG